MCRYTGGFQEGCVACLHPFHPASQQLHLDLQSTKRFHAFWFTPLLLCTSGGGLWLAFPSWVHLKFPGWGTDNKGAVTLRRSAAKCSPRVLGRYARFVQKYCCQHQSWQLKVTQVWTAVTPLDLSSSHFHCFFSPGKYLILLKLQVTDVVEGTRLHKSVKRATSPQSSSLVCQWCSLHILTLFAVQVEAEVTPLRSISLKTMALSLWRPFSAE